MTFVLDSSVVIGELVLTALSQISVSEYRSERRIVVSGSKRPVALIVQRGDQLVAFNSNGDTVELDDLETLYPGVTSEFVSTTIN